MRWQGRCKHVRGRLFRPSESSLHQTASTSPQIPFGARRSLSSSDAWRRNLRLRPDGQYTLEEVSPEVLAIVIDFCYSEALPAPEALGGLSVIASLMHAAGFLLSAPLRRACLVRALGTLGDGDLDIKGVFEIYEAACTHRDMESVNAVRADDLVDGL